MTHLVDFRVITVDSRVPILIFVRKIALDIAILLYNDKILPKVEHRYKEN
jgi:hypothetical protein